MPRKAKAEEPTSSSEELVRAFFVEAEIACRPLLSGSNARSWQTLEQYGSEGMELTTPDKLEGFAFYAAFWFEGADIAGEISYGNRETCLNAVVGPRARDLRYGYWEWANAMGTPDLSPRETQFIFHVERVRHSVRKIVDLMIILAPEIAAARPAVVAKIETARAKVVAESAARSRESARERINSRADEAFKRKDWPEVIRALESMPGALTPAEAKKLAYAREPWTKRE